MAEGIKWTSSGHLRGINRLRLNLNLLTPCGLVGTKVWTPVQHVGTNCNNLHYNTLQHNVSGRQVIESIFMAIWSRYLRTMLWSRGVSLERRGRQCVDSFLCPRPVCVQCPSESLAIKRPRTRSTAARQVGNAYERDLVTNQNVQFRPFASQTYLLESL